MQGNESLSLAQLQVKIMLQFPLNFPISHAFLRCFLCLWNDNLALRSLQIDLLPGWAAARG